MVESVGDDVGQHVFGGFPEKQTCQVHHRAPINAIVDEKSIRPVVDDEHRPGRIAERRRENSKVLLDHRRFVAKELEVGDEAVFVH